MPGRASAASYSLGKRPPWRASISCAARSRFPARIVPRYSRHTLSHITIFSGNRVRGQEPTQFGFGKNNTCPPQVRAASTRSNATSKDGFVEASLSRVLRDGEGMFHFKLNQHLNAKLERRH